jgi:anti-sigma B factor antagonist
MSTGPSNDAPPGQLTAFSVECSRPDGGPLIAAISGDLDIANADLLTDAVLVPDLDPKPGVVLDFTGVDFMDSTGLRAVLEIARRLEDDDAGLVLLSPADSVRKLLGLAGLDDRIPVAVSLPQAHAFLTAPGNAA